MSEPLPVVVLDHIGYRYYQDADGRKFLPAGDYQVRLVTDLRRVGQAVGDEVVSVVGIRRGDQAVLADAARFQFAHAGRPAERLVAITESLLLPAARLRDELGIAGPTERQTLMFRDKVIMKEHLRANGVRVPDFAPFDEGAARRLLRGHGRLVAKPRRGEGSAGVVFLDSDDDIRRFAADPAADPDEYEVEERVDGTVFHIDSVVRGGVALAATAGRSLDDTTAYLGLRAYRSVAVDAGPTLHRLLAFNHQVLACHPDFSGVTHHEVFLTDAGDVCFCEIAARPGGGGIIAGFLSRTGVNLDEMTIRSQLGAPIPDPPPPAPHLTGYALVYAAPGRLTVDLTPPAAPWIVDTQLRFAVGDVMPMPTAWGQSAVTVTVSGDSEREVASRLDEVIGHVGARLERAVAAVG